MINKIYRSVAKYIPASKFGGAVIGGKKMSANEFKDYVVNNVLKKHSLSGAELEKILKESGEEGSQLSKRRKFIKMITGNDEKKLTKKEEIRLQERIKARIAASRYTSEKVGEQTGGLAGQLRNRDKKSTLDKVLTAQAGDDKGGKMKIGASAIGIQGPSYKVTSKGGGGRSGPGPSSKNTGFGGGYATSSNAGLGGGHGAGSVNQLPKPPIGFNPMR